MPVPAPSVVRHLATLLLAVWVAGCAKPAPSLLSPGYDTASAAKLHHVGNGFRNVGSFTPSDGAPFTPLIADSYRNETGPAPEPLDRAAALAGVRAAARQQLAATWVGHSTYLLRVGEAWVLTDPHFSAYAAPAPGLGPRRLAAPGLSVEDLPPIDVVLVSHNHYEHMDGPSLRAIAARFPDAVAVVPLKNGATLRRAGFRDVREVDWFDTVEAGGLRITGTPAVHSSRRLGSQTNRALWGGFSVSDGRRRIYFAGDTGFGSFIRDVRRELGRHDAAIVPIGAYRPQSLESERHTTPEDAVRLAKVLGARVILPMHWGTFALAPEPFAEQRSRFLRAAGPPGRLLRPGETLAIAAGGS